jgi:hypothetical protein
MSANCPRTHIRLTARTKDGLPSGALKLQDFRVDFTQGTAAIVSVSDGTPKKADSPDTDILFAIPPFSDLNDSITKQLMRALAKADNFKFKLAILAPDGSITPFTSDLALVRRKLAEAISGKKRSLGRDAWPAAEQKAFLTLRVLPGRHAIVNLMAPSKLRESGEKQGFRNDMTLDFLAQYDMTQVYRLVTPVPIGLNIPGGDASGEGSGFFVGSDPAWQLQQVQAASAAQDAFWAAKRFYATPTGGRAEDSIETLLQDVLADSRGTYDLVVQPKFECRVGAMYSVAVSLQKPGILIFAPSAIQMLPISTASP